jgi:hypothetical protein
MRVGLKESSEEKVKTLENFRLETSLTIQYLERTDG